MGREYNKSVKKGKKKDQQIILSEGMVAKIFNKQVSVLTKEGIVLCPLSNTLMSQKDSCVVGDQVRLELTGPGQYRIAEVLPRRSSFYRGNRRSPGEDILVASNASFVIAVIPGESLLHQTGFGEQAILAARRAGLPIVIYVSKMDMLREDERALVEKRRGLFADTAEYCFTGSRKEVPKELVSLVKDKAVVLVGDRDSGKTALVHDLLAELDGEEAPPYIRQSTSAANLLSSNEGTLFMDTPGFRDFALNHVSREERESVFPEITEAGKTCAFRSCTHTYEEDCGVIRALREGRLEKDRLSAYQQLAGEVPKAEKKKIERPVKREEIGPLVRDAYGNVHADYRSNACLETFTCQNCGATVVPEGAGSKHRNHCPSCLCSVHVDDEPGDRSSLCHGTMDPIAVWVRKGGEWALIHKCRTCGELSSNRVAADDNPYLLMSIAVKPLSNPPFPLSQLSHGLSDTSPEKRD